MKKTNINSVKKSLIKDINNSKKIVDILSNINYKEDNSIDLLARKALLPKNRIKYIKNQIQKSLSDDEKQRISNLPLYLSLNTEHNIYDTSLYFEYKEILSRQYLPDNIIDKSMISEEKVFVCTLDGWANFNNTLSISFFNGMKYSSEYYKYCISMYILFHMALEDTNITECKEYNFTPLHKTKKEHPNINLANRMLSCDLYYYSPSIEEILTSIKCYQPYLDWLKENRNLSFEKKFNKGIDLFLEKDISQLANTEYQDIRVKYNMIRSITSKTSIISLILGTGTIISLLCIF